MSVRLSVITVTRNRCALLKQKLSALTEQTLPPEHFELIVLANGGADETRKLLEAAKPPYTLKTLVSETCLSPARARNLCVAEAVGSVLYFSDDDCLPDPETLAKHLLAQTRACVAVGGLEFSHAGQREVWRPKRVNFWNTNGANTSVPARHFRDAGGFDEALSGYGGEDVALGYALRALPFIALPDAKAVHLGPNPARSGDLDKAHSAGRNAQRLASRYPALAYRLGVHKGVLGFKRWALLGPPRHAWRQFAPRFYAYERAYLQGAIKEQQRG